MQTDSPPDAPYGADVTSNGWRFELDLVRVKRSDTWALASPSQRPWLLMIWSVAWEQAPCGSLPSDSRLIAAHIGMPTEEFAILRDVLLRGWWLASDGRLYHDVLVSRVLEMLAKRDANRDRQSRHRASKAAKPHEQPPAKTPEQMSKDELWSSGKSLLAAAGVPARQAGSAIGKLIKKYTEPVVLEAVRDACITRPADPMSYLVGICERSAGRRPGAQASVEARNFTAVDNWATQ